MSVTQVRQLTPRGGDYGERFQRSFTKRFLVITDSKNDGPVTVAAAAGVPSIGEWYQTGNEVDVGAYVTGISISDADGDPNKWFVDVTYTSSQSEDPENPEPEDPIQREAVYGVRFERFQEPMEGEYDDATATKFSTKPPMNTRGQPYLPAPLVDSTRPVVTVQVNEASLNLHAMMALQDAINTTDFAGFGSRTLKLNVTKADQAFENGIEFYRKTYELAYNRRGWDKRVLNRGFHTDEDGNMVPVMWNAAGTATITSPAVFTTHVAYRAIAFESSTDIPQAVKDLHPTPP